MCDLRFTAVHKKKKWNMLKHTRRIRRPFLKSLSAGDFPKKQLAHVTDYVMSKNCSVTFSIIKGYSYQNIKKYEIVIFLPKIAINYPLVKVSLFHLSWIIPVPFQLFFPHYYYYYFCINKNPLKFRLAMLFSNFSERKKKFESIFEVDRMEINSLLIINKSVKHEYIYVCILLV